MNPSKELIAAIKDVTIINGRVVSVIGNKVGVSTSEGVVTSFVVDGITLVIGDTVVLKNGVISGKLRPAGSVPVYFL